MKYYLNESTKLIRLEVCKHFKRVVYEDVKFKAQWGLVEVCKHTLFLIR